MRHVHWLFVLALAGPLAHSQTPLFVIESDFGEEGAWTEEWLARCHARLVRMMEAPGVRPPEGIRVTVRRDADSRGVAGGATATGLSFASDRWPCDRWRLWILAHELVNLFAHHYGGAGGYPSDWWADGRSPFPVYASCLVAGALGEEETAAWLRTVDADKQDQRLFWALHERFGFALFARFLRLVRADGVDLARIGEAWPAADERRSAWAIAYLSLAAGENLAPLFRRHGIGTEPPDWRQRLPHLPFRTYSVSDREVDDLMKLRAHLFAQGARGRAVEILRALFRQGRTWVPDGGEEPETAPCPIAFRVESDFGADSDWVAPYLSAAASAIIALLDDPDLPLPASVAVRLRRNAAVQGVGGGSGAASIDLVSDAWMKERFRLWILASELAVVFRHHVGGSVPDDWFGYGGKPFATYLAGVVLRRLGHADVAGWLRSLHRRPDHQLLWSLHEAHGFDVFAKAFALMREEGIDLAAATSGDPHPARARVHRLAAWLSRAAGESVVPLLRRHRIGAATDGAPKGFRPYEIDSAEVERLMQKRAK